MHVDACMLCMITNNHAAPTHALVEHFDYDSTDLAASHTSSVLASRAPSISQSTWAGQAHAAVRSASGGEESHLSCAAAVAQVCFWRTGKFHLMSWPDFYFFGHSRTGFLHEHKKLGVSSVFLIAAADRRIEVLSFNLQEPIGPRRPSSRSSQPSISFLTAVDRLRKCCSLRIRSQR